MKRLVGGDFLLDMSPIELELSVDGTTKTNITDNEVLEQLTDLKRFIGSPSMVKPIWCKLTNGETDELIVARGTLAVVDVGEFEICIPLNEFKLTISVEFTQMTDADDNLLDDWYIDTNDAKYILISDTQSLAGELADFEGDVSITGDLSVTGSINGEEHPSVKPIYWHTVRLYKAKQAGFTAFNCVLIILNNTPTPIDLTEFVRLTTTSGFYAAVIQGYVGANTNVDPTLECIGIKPSTLEGEFVFDTFDPTTKETTERRASYESTIVTDLGANKIN